MGFLNHDLYFITMYLLFSPVVKCGVKKQSTTLDLEKSVLLAQEGGQGSMSFRLSFL